MNFLFIVGSNPPPECSDMIKYPRYEPDICHCDLIKEELGGEFSQCILDPPKESSGLLRPISTSSYVLFIFLKLFPFLLIHIEYSTWHFNFEWKKGFAKSFYNFNVYSVTYELMLTFLFNFDHLATIWEFIMHYSY